MGMTHSMTAMLQNRGVSYADQTIFYIAVYPFTCKWSFYDSVLELMCHSILVICQNFESSKN